jgi:hypothetical protein
VEEDVGFGGHFMARHRLSARQVASAQPGNKLSDGLRLDVDVRGGRSWVFRYKSPVTGKERYMGLGSAPGTDTKAISVSLSAARVAADKARALVKEGVDMTNFPRDVAEMALAHVVADETEAAYRRSDALAKRRRLMEEWAAYCVG